MRRRSFIARSVIVAGLGISVAGCSGGGDAGDGGGPDSGGSNGSNGGGSNYEGVVRSEVDGLEITANEYTDTGIEGRFPVTVTVENTGDQETNVEDYDYGYTVYDSGRSDITGGSSASADQKTVASGESTDVLLTTIVDGDPKDVASYEVVISCTSLSEGVYCGDSTSQ